jgi:antitoxin CptB
MDDRLKKLKFRASHRGFKEADLLLGAFADAWLERLDDRDVDDFEALLACEDRLIYDWATGKQDVPRKFDNNIMTLLQNFKIVP